MVFITFWLYDLGKFSPFFWVPEMRLTLPLLCRVVGRGGGDLEGKPRRGSYVYKCPPPPNSCPRPL